MEEVEITKKKNMPHKYLMCIRTNYSATSRSAFFLSFSFGWSQTRVSSSDLHHGRNNLYRKMLRTRMEDIYWIINPFVRQNNPWVGNALILALGSMLIIFLIYQPERRSGKERAPSRASPPLVFLKYS